MCSSLGVYPVGDSLHFLGLMCVFFPMLGKFIATFSSNIFSGSFSLFSFCDPYNVSVQHCPRGLRLSSFLVLFSLFCSRAMFFTSLSSSPLTHSSAPFILLWSPSSVFFMSVCSLNLLSLLNISCIFLVCVSVLFPTSWITFTVITLNSFQVDCLSLLH